MSSFPPPGRALGAYAERLGVDNIREAYELGGNQLPRYRTLVALANALDVPLDRLLVG